MHLSPNQADSARQRSRRNYFVDKRFQLKYSGLLAGAGAAISALFGGMMYVVHLDAQRAWAALCASAQDALSGAGVTLVWLWAATTLLMAFTFGLLGVLMTHRVAGPLFVINRYMAALAQGRYPAMRQLRRSDELQDFFQTFQKMAESLKEQQIQEAEVLDDLLRQTADAPGSVLSAEARARLAALRDKKRQVGIGVDLAARPQ